MNETRFAGVDVGASTTKAVVLDLSADILGYAVTHSGADFEGAAEAVFRESLALAENETAGKVRVVSTGYGRRNVPFAQSAMTEISCHAKGS